MPQVTPQGPLEWDVPLFRMAMAQFEQALPYADVSDTIAERLRYPERAVMFSVPVHLDDGPSPSPAYRVQHSTVLGPTKGGIRYDPDVTLGEPPPRLLDDLEVRFAPAVRRGQGRSALHAEGLSLGELERMTRFAPS